MTKRQRTSLLIIAATAYLGFAAILANDMTARPIARTVRSEIENRQRLLDFASITPFTWTDMYVFRAQAPRRNICATLRLARLRCWWMFPAEINRAELFVVFLDEGKIVHYEHWYAITDPELLGPDRISLSDAQFEVIVGDTATYMNHRPRSHSMLGSPFVVALIANTHGLP